MLGLTGQGRLDQLPAADLGFLKLVGRLRTGDPFARATEEEVVDEFARFEPWAGIAGIYALHAHGKKLAPAR
jgi:3-methyladenine DNA glycosylase/8-oxoguanine DNA glycosylase